jgi:hypothetical protein
MQRKFSKGISSIWGIFCMPANEIECLYKPAILVNAFVEPCLPHAPKHPRHIYGRGMR